MTTLRGGRGDRRNDRDEQQQQQEQQPFDRAANWIRRVNEMEGDADNFILRLDDKSISDDTVRSIIEKHENANSTTLVSTLRKKLKVWAKLPSYLHRQYYFYTIAQLKARVKELDSRAVVDGKNKERLLDLVVDCERKRKQQNTM